MKILSLGKNLKYFFKNSKQALVIKPPFHKDTPNFRNIEGIRIPIYQELQPTKFEQTNKKISTPFDDSDQKNCLSIKVEKKEIDIPQIIKEAQNYEIPFTLQPFQKVPLKQFIFETQKLKTSIKKSVPLFKLLSGCHIFEAIQILDSSPKKVAKFALQELKTNGRKFLEDKGLNLKRVYIVGVITQKISRTKKIRYHAKGRFGIMKTDHCTFKFIFSEKPMKEFYKQLILGKTPSMLSYILKQHLISQNADFNEVKKVQLLLHSKGKYVQKTQFQRRCLKKHEEYKLKGITVPFDTIKEFVLENEAEEFEQKYGYLVNYDQKLAKERIETRKELLKKIDA